MHLRWGNYEGPHHCDVPLAEIIDIAFTARPATISFEAANPRHAHEWILFEQIKLPDGKIINPGVIESKSNFIEHPELIAQRIARYANLVGRDNVIAGSDCGFGTWVGQAAVDPDVVWAKLSAMAEGARLATKQFWGGGGGSVQDPEYWLYSVDTRAGVRDGGQRPRRFELAARMARHSSDRRNLGRQCSLLDPDQTGC